MVRKDSMLRATEENESSLETMIRHGLSQMANEGRPPKLEKRLLDKSNRQTTKKVSTPHTCQSSKRPQVKQAVYSFLLQSKTLPQTKSCSRSPSTKRTKAPQKRSKPKLHSQNATNRRHTQADQDIHKPTKSQRSK